MTTEERLAKIRARRLALSNRYSQVALREVSYLQEEEYEKRIADFEIALGECQKTASRYAGEIMELRQRVAHLEAEATLCRDEGNHHHE